MRAKHILFYQILFVFLLLTQSPSVSAQTSDQFNFSVSNLKNVLLGNPTSLQFGPDDRLYVSEQAGLIKVITIKRNGPNDYSATATETIDLINKIPNHNDDGSLSSTITT